MPRTYRFELSQRGREKLRQLLGPQMEKRIAHELDKLGISKTPTTLFVGGKSYYVPEELFNELNEKVSITGNLLLREALKEATISRISVDLNGNYGTMKCFNSSGKILAIYEVTSGEIDPTWTDKIFEETKSTMKIKPDTPTVELAVPEGMDYTIENKGPVPPGKYTIRPFGVVGTNEVGREFVIEIPEKSIQKVEMPTISKITITVEYLGDWLEDPYKFWAAVWNEYKHTHSDWGTHFVSLQPSPGTETFGRSSFYIHGGKDPGSAGCIDIGSKMSDFAKRLLVGMSKRSVEVTVRHSKRYISQK